MISTVEKVATRAMKPRNQAPIGDCANEWIELISALRVRKVPKIERQNAPVTSGLINSIHSFAQSPIGAWFLGFIALVATFSTVLIIWRLPLLRARTKLESLASREAAFLYNNLLLVAFTLTVLWGVAFPPLSDSVRR